MSENKEILSAFAEDTTAQIVDEENHVTQRDAVIAVMKIIGSHQEFNVSFFNSPESHYYSIDAEVSAICISSHIRCRKAQLKYNWWMNDSGPLLISDDSGKPYAALWNKNAYEIFSYDQKLTDRKDKQWNQSAFSFYPGFPDGKITLRKLIGLSVGQLKSELKWIVFYTFLIGLFGMLTPLGIGYIFNEILPGSQEQNLITVIAGLVVCTLVITAMNYLKLHSILRAESRLGHFLQASVWDKLLRHPVSFFKQFSSGDLTERALGINQIRKHLGVNTISSLTELIYMLFYSILLFYYSGVLAIMSLTLIMLFSAINYIILRKEFKQRKIIYEINGGIIGGLVEQVNAISKIKLTGIENKIIRNWSGKIAALKKAEFSAARYLAWTETINLIAPVCCSLILFIFPIYTELNIPVSSFIAFQATFAIFLYSGISFSSSMLNMLNVISLYKRLEPILSDEQSKQQYPPVAAIGGKLEIRDVSFTYTNLNNPVLNGINFHANPGEFIAITGPSGSGKSTILRLLLGFETPGTGSIFIDDHDILMINFESMKRFFGVVLQNDGILPGTILDNVRGTGNYTIENVMHALEKADLAEEISNLPMGIHTYIPFGGGIFSGGQIQRILIARALVGNPKILFLDEATSALDNISQSKITKVLEKLPMTKIVIAHRLSTIQNADRVYFLEGGKMQLLPQASNTLKYSVS